MTRTPGYLAALASSAVPGLDPVAVRAARGLPGNRCDVAFVTDTQRRAWVVRVPTTPAVGAQLDTSVPLLGLISRRLPFQVPSPRGFVGVAEGRAMVYPFLHGRSVVLEETPPGPGVAAELGRALAALHNVDRAVFEEAGLPAYDSETYRRRHLADLDRAAATGHVPTALLSRWERALEDVSAWRFAPTPVHGDLGGGRVLVSFTDEHDSGTATVRAITGWEHAQVADPADDFAGVAEECSAAAFESVLEAYAVARIERPDRHLRLRARLAAELRALRRLLDAVTAAEPLLITRRASELRALDERTADQPDLVPPPPVEAESRMPVATVRSTAGSDADAEPSAPLPNDATADEPPKVPPGSQERDTSQDTQRLLVGDAAEATTVIPEHELARLRAARQEGESGATGADRDAAGAHETIVVEVATEHSPATDESWYQVIEPIVPDDPNSPDPQSLDPDRPDTEHHGRDASTQPTVVLTETAPKGRHLPSVGNAADSAPAPVSTPAPDSAPVPEGAAGDDEEPSTDGSAGTGQGSADDPGQEPNAPTTAPARVAGSRRRHRRATRPQRP